MAGWVIRLVLIYLIVRAIARLARGILEGMHPPREQEPAAVPLARDPVCGTFVVPSRAVTIGRGADMRFFCSEKCRRRYEMTGRPEQGRGTGAPRDGEPMRSPIEQSKP